MKITVSGNSGCSISVMHHQGRLCVVKAASDTSYVSRLQAQISKQKKAREQWTLPFVHIPEILEEQQPNADDQVDYYAVMEYLNYQDYSDYFARASLPALNQFANHLIALVEFQLAQSTMATVDISCFLNKLTEIRAKVANSYQADLKLSQLDKLEAEVKQEDTTKDGIVLPLGPTHGDLTLANMMISADGSRVGIFDFLDSYLDSPLVDIAKIRQDTQLFWSQLMTEQAIDHARYNSIMAHLDRKIDTHFQQYDWYRRYYGLIQGINIARIFPYEKHARVTDFTTGALNLLGY